MSESDQRNVEKDYGWEEYCRAHLENIGSVIFPRRVAGQYVERLERVLDRRKTGGLTFVVDFSSGVASLIANPIFRQLEVDAVTISGFANATHAGYGANLKESLDRVHRIVPIVGAVFGCVVGSTGEDVYFVDDAGQYVPTGCELVASCRLRGRLWWCFRRTLATRTGRS